MLAQEFGDLPSRKPQDGHAGNHVDRVDHLRADALAQAAGGAGEDQPPGGRAEENPQRDQRGRGVVRGGDEPEPGENRGEGEDGR